VLEGLCCGNPLQRVLLKASTYQVYQVRVDFVPVLFKVRYIASQNGQLKVSNFLRLVSNRHFVEHDAEGPHVDGRCDPRFVSQFWSLVVRCADNALHEDFLVTSRLLRVPLKCNVAQAEVNNLSDWNFFLLLLASLFL
jgi:hypothetical protein